MSAIDVSRLLRPEDKQVVPDALLNAPLFESVPLTVKHFLFYY